MKKKKYLKEGVCIRVMQSNMIQAAVHHEESDQIKILELINQMILNYNDSKYYAIEDKIIKAVRLLENKNRFTTPFDKNQASLSQYSHKLIKKIAETESFDKYDDCGGMIVLSGDEVSKLQDKSKHNLTIDLDKSAITFKTISFTCMSDDEFLEKYPGSNLKSLDVFEYDLYYLKFNALQEAIEFYKKHNTKDNLYKRYFKISKKEGLVYEIAR